jgi:hypothetical protein
MTVGVDDDLRIREYPGDDSANPRQVTFKFLGNDDLRVTQVNADASETVLVRGTHYTVSGAGNDSGGNVTPLAPIATGTSWRIEGNMALGQPTDYTAGGDFPAESHERGLDRAMIGLQEARRDVNSVGDRALKVGPGLTAPQLDLAGLVEGDILTFQGGKLQRLKKEMFAGMFLAGAAVTGSFVPSFGTGNDPALRYDLALVDAGARLMAMKRLEKGAAARTAFHKMLEWASIQDFGAIGDGVSRTVAQWIVPGALARFPSLAALQVEYPHVTATTNNLEWAAWQAAIDSNKRVEVIDGTYDIGDGRLIAKSGMYLEGRGENRTIVKSNVVGQSMMRTTTTATFMHATHIWFQGNGLADVLGSGHGFNWIDPAIGSGASTPQNCQFEYLRFSGFNGLDVVDNVGVTKTAACAVIMHDCIAVTHRHIYVDNCGHGWQARRTQNCRIDNFVCDTITKSGGFGYQNENLVVDECDYVYCGDGTVDAGYPAGVGAVGALVFVLDENTVVSNTKAKSYNGTALVTFKNCMGAVIDGGWYRPNAVADIDHIGIYVEAGDLTIDGNPTFDPAVSLFPARKYTMVHAMATQNAPSVVLVVKSGTFQDVSTQGMRANILVSGNNAARTAFLSVDDGVIFGSRSSLSAPSTVDANIELNNVTIVKGSRVGRVVHRKSSNGTLAVGIKTVGTVNGVGNLRVEQAYFEVSGTGVITAEYSGVRECELNGTSAAIVIPIIAAGASTFFDVTVPGAVKGDFALGKHPNVPDDVIIVARGHAANTVRVWFRNEGGAPTVASAAATLSAKVFT